MFTGEPDESDWPRRRKACGDPLVHLRRSFLCGNGLQADITWIHGRSYLSVRVWRGMEARRMEPNIISVGSKSV
jgi:hypothetical protein